MYIRFYIVEKLRLLFGLSAYVVLTAEEQINNNLKNMVLIKRVFITI